MSKKKDQTPRFRNISPKIMRQLREIGVESYQDLQTMTGERAYENLLALGYEPDINLLYSLIGAELDIGWQDAAEEISRGSIVLQRVKLSG